MKERGWTSEVALQGYFTQRIAAILKAKGRRMQGWSEVMSASLPTDAIVQQWLDPKAGAAAARLGHDVVVSQHEWLYFDYGYDRTPMRKTYAFDPMPAGLRDDDPRRHVLGVEACLWTEQRPTEAACDEFLWPRMLAVAEIGWTPQESRDWDDFAKRLDAAGYQHLARRGRMNPDALRDRGQRDR
jgi:hexosaminidase